MKEEKEGQAISRLAKPAIDTDAEERRRPVCKVTPHIAREVNDAYVLCEKHRERPYHYYIGFDGLIVAGLEETSVSRVSNCSDNDEQAITILVSNSDVNYKWPVSDASLAALFDLLEDISRRYDLSLMYTGNKEGSITTHCMFTGTLCPGPYLLSKLREMSFMLDNKLKGLPYIPQRGSGIYRLKTNPSRGNHRGVYDCLNEAIQAAITKKCNVYDNNGIEVFNYEISGNSPVWDNNDDIGIGDIVTSKNVICYAAPGSKYCCLKVRGMWRTYIPELGGYIPNQYISMVNPKDDYKSGKTAFILDEGRVEDIDEAADKVKVHGIWVYRKPLLKKKSLLRSKYGN